MPGASIFGRDETGRTTRGVEASEATTYGIHGTPEPDTIGKTVSHGCIRLTNWNAVDLAAMAHPGTVVKFEDQDTPVVPLASK